MFSLKYFSQIILVLLSSFLFMSKAEAGVMVSNLRVSEPRIAIPSSRTFPNNFDNRINVSFKITNTWMTPINITSFNIEVFDDDSFNMEDRNNDMLGSLRVSLMPITLEKGEMYQTDDMIVFLEINLLNDAIERNPDEGNTLELFTSGSVTFTEQDMEHIDFFNTVTSPEPTSTLSFLALGTLGAASTLKSKLNQKSTEKETPKVG